MNWRRFFQAILRNGMVAARFSAPYVRRGVVTTLRWCWMTFIYLPIVHQLGRFQRWFVGVAPLVFAVGLIVYLVETGKTEFLNTLFIFGITIFCMLFGVRVMFKGLPTGKKKGRGRRR